MSRHLVACLVVASSAFAAQAAAPPVPRYEHRKQHDPNGIGKFYLGREIAYVMGHQAADWLERPERVQEERTDKLLTILPLKPGMIVADVGAGSGYFTFPMARKVGDQGKVYAIDVQKEMLALIRRKMKAQKVENVEPVMGAETNPRLPRNEVDLILMVDVYHEFSHPYEMTKAMVESLRPGGLLVFVEYRLEDEKVPIKLVHKMSEAQVKREMTEHPSMRHVRTVGTLPWQHVILFEKRR